MEFGGEDKSGQCGTVSWARILCVEAFPKSRLEEVCHGISGIPGLSRVKSPPRGNLNLMSDRLIEWKCDDMDACFNEILKVTANWGGSGDLFSKYIQNVSVDSLDSMALPFYILVVRIDLIPDNIIASEELAEDLACLRNSFRAYLERFDGLSKIRGGMSPRVPAITIVSSHIDETKFGRMKDIAASLAAEAMDGREKEDRLGIGDMLRTLEPVQLGRNYMDDMKSYFLLEPNLIMILNNDPCSVSMRTPLVVLTSPAMGLLDSEPHEFPLAPYMTNYSLNNPWFLSHILTVPMATLSWLGDSQGQVEGMHQSLSSIGMRISTHPEELVSDSVLAELTAIGLESSAYGLAANLLQTGFGRTYVTWAEDRTCPLGEIPILSSELWVMSLGAVHGHDDGYLSTLGSVLSENIHALSEQVGELSHQANVLLNSVHQARLSESTRSTVEYSKAVKNSSEKTEEMTQALLSSQKQMGHLTSIMVILTAIIVIVEIFSSDMGEYAGLAYISFLFLIGLIYKPRLLKCLIFTLATGLACLLLIGILWPDTNALLGAGVSMLIAIISFVVFWTYYPKEIPDSLHVER